MSVHINAKEGEISKIVLMPGDPMRARYIAENFLDDSRLVSQIRNMCYYTGLYRDIPITVGGSGMGCPSIGIYSYELYEQYGVDCIIRIGTAGAYTTELELFDLLNVEKAFGESTYAVHAHGFLEDHFPHQGKAFDQIRETAAGMQTPLKSCNIHSSDVFYRAEKGIPKIAADNNCLAVEMESFALFSNAKKLSRMAACLLTVSDIIPTGNRMSVDDREKALKAMISLALQSAVQIFGSLNN